MLRFQQPTMSKQEQLVSLTDSSCVTQKNNSQQLHFISAYVMGQPVLAD